MAAKLLHSLTDDKKQQQIGCMTGFIQLFERSQVVLPKRITAAGYSHRSVFHQDEANLGRESCEVDQPYCPYHQHASEVRSNERLDSSERLGIESSRVSFSSSRSSSFSSLDYNKVADPEPSSLDRIIFPESPSLSRSLSHSSSSWRMRQPLIEFEEAVEVVVMGCETEYSSRSLQVPKPETYGSPKLKQSRIAASKVEQGAPLYHHLGKQSSTPFCESMGSDSSAKLKKLPELSLDSRKSSMQRYGMRKTHPSQRPPSIVEKLMGLEAMPESRLVDQNKTEFVDSCSRENVRVLLNSTPICSPCTPLLPSSPRSSRKAYHSVQKWRNGDLVMKPILSSRIPVEPAPWKLQPDLDRSSPKLIAKNLRLPASDTNVFPSIYNEFERRLKHVEFQRSANELTTLKQILDAVQEKGSPQIEKEEVSTNETSRDQDADSDHLDLNFETPKQKMLPKGARKSVPKVSREGSLRTLNSPIVVMKPVKHVEKSDIAASSVIRSEGVQHLKKPQSRHSAVSWKDLNQRTICRSPPFTPVKKKLLSTLPNKLQQLHRAKNTSLAESAVSVSLRMQKKKFELEKKPRPNIKTNNYNAAKLGLKKFQQHTFSSSPGVQLQSKPASLPQRVAPSIKVSTEAKTASYYADNDTEVSSKLRVDLTNGAHSPARKVARQVLSGIRKNKPSLRLNNSVVCLALPAPEQPSPIFVLDSTMFRDDCPSPVKILASCTAATKDRTWICSDDQLSGNAADLTSDTSRKKLKHIDDLIKKLRGLNSKHDESNTGCTTSIIKKTSRDQRYISQILLASGFLLQDLGSSASTLQLHPSGHPINPQLFFVLEQTKSRSFPKGSLNTSSKSHRRLIFDSLNEILAKELDSLGIICSNSNLPSKTKKLTKRSITSQQLLNNLCSQIEKMQSKSKDHCRDERFDEKHENDDDGLKNILYEDVTHGYGDWTSFDKTIPEVVLFIERMLFKDLVKEIVMGEAVSSS